MKDEGGKVDNYVKPIRKTAGKPATRVLSPPIFQSCLAILSDEVVPWTRVRHVRDWLRGGIRSYVVHLLVKDASRSLATREMSGECGET